MVTKSIMDDKIDYYDDYGHLIRTEKAPTYDD